MRLRALAGQFSRFGAIDVRLSHFIYFEIGTTRQIELCHRNLTVGSGLVNAKELRYLVYITVTNRKGHNQGHILS